jgi:hypothetical protein
MTSLYEDLKQGLEEAVAYEKGQGTAKKKIYPNGSAFRLLEVLSTSDPNVTDYVVVDK